MFQTSRGGVATGLLPRPPAGVGGVSKTAQWLLLMLLRLLRSDWSMAPGCKMAAMALPLPKMLVGSSPLLCVNGLAPPTIRRQLLEHVSGEGGGVSGGGMSGLSGGGGDELSGGGGWCLGGKALRGTCELL